ncbi:MAG: hypothetical protein KDC39_04155 [Actinobacteria bacterium]|nr:hypothetical protein [Actinomycetota bacterium]
MNRVLVALAGLLAALLLGSCASEESTTVSDPFTGEWESTGGERIALIVSPATDGDYPVQIKGGSVDLSLTAKQSGEGVYKAEPDSGSVWTFRLVGDDLLTATAAPKGGTSATTSFKKVQG